MPPDQRQNLDATDDEILRQLQADGRLSIADLGRAVSMSASSVADRVRRLTELGVIQGYTAVVDPAALGYPLTAFIRLRLTTGTGKPFHEFVARTPRVLEAHHLTGDDCFLLKAIATSMPDLEELTDKLVTFGHVTTNLVFSSPTVKRALPPSAD